MMFFLQWCHYSTKFEIKPLINLDQLIKLNSFPPLLIKVILVVSFRPSPALRLN